MITAVILAMLLAAAGPLWLPYALAKGGRGAAYAYCLTNLITLAPMTAITAAARNIPALTCHPAHFGAPCDGIPTSLGWYVFTLVFIALALWSLIVSGIAIAYVFRNR